MRSSTSKKVHFIGVGGVGMSGIARVAFDQGMQVTGSDLKESRYTKQLKDAGIEVTIGHEADTIDRVDPDIVVVSTAILEDNLELVRASEKQIPIWHRAKMLAKLGVGKQTLAVAGTHGKTTTSAMLASTLDGMGLEPSFLVGGLVRSYGTNAHSGKGKFYVVEADESDKSFTFLDPCAILVTNIENDHLDHYGNLEEIYSKFEEFISSLPEDGVCVVCGEDAALVALVENLGIPYFSYGFGDSHDIVISKYTRNGLQSDFVCTMPDGKQVSGHLMQSPGRHNVLNASGVLALAWALGLPLDEAAHALAKFSGVRRRFDLIGEVAGITVVDDYAHHPTEIAATIGAAKKLGFERIVVLFQPHRYSRVGLFTEVLRDEFSCAFNQADEVVFMDVFAAGEMPVPGVTGKTFMKIIQNHPGAPHTTYIPRRMEVVPHLVSELKPGDLMITMGAGDVTLIAPQLVDVLSKKFNER